ncbi:MAG: hypothetical protein R3E18_09350 [Sphingomonadaceae bacterium]|nr:hypothetical protein [Sphingomonadaceae bacterium]
MRRVVLLSVCMALISCGSGENPEAAQAPGEDFEPGKILYPDIETNELFGASCAFVPDGGGIAAIALAMEEGGVMKLNGEITRFAKADSTQQLGAPLMAFTGDIYGFSITLDEASARSHGDSATEYDGQLEVRNSEGQGVYKANGLVQCGA